MDGEGEGEAGNAYVKEEEGVCASWHQTLEE